MVKSFEKTTEKQLVLFDVVWKSWSERSRKPSCGCSGEAEAALVAAGQRFLAVAERDAADARALGNWGRALCLRAELASDPQAR